MNASASVAPRGVCELVLEGGSDGVGESRRFVLPSVRTVEAITTKGGEFGIVVSANEVYISLHVNDPATQKAWVSVLSPRHDSGTCTFEWPW